MRRMAMNSLKQKWKDFICWLVDAYGLSNSQIAECSVNMRTYFDSNRRHDVDNTVPKFILDGLVESGLIVDDNCGHLISLRLWCGVDKGDPRTEIEVLVAL
jgi:Holliday junction resolvase RusA-like endonuclease